MDPAFDFERAQHTFDKARIENDFFETLDKEFVEAIETCFNNAKSFEHIIYILQYDEDLPLAKALRTIPRNTDRKRLQKEVCYDVLRTSVKDDQSFMIVNRVNSISVGVYFSWSVRQFFVMSVGLLTEDGKLYSYGLEYRHPSREFLEGFFGQLFNPFQPMTFKV